MDPVTALSLACGAVQLVETGVKITKQIKEVYEYGSDSALENISLWTDQLSTGWRQLQQEVQNTGPIRTSFDLRIRQLVTTAIDHAVKLEDLLKRIAPPQGQPEKRSNYLQRTFRAVAQVSRANIKKVEIEHLSARLRECRSDIDSAILNVL